MANGNTKLLVSPAPHARDKMTGLAMMWETGLALLPATIVGILLFGTKGLLPIIVSITTALAAELAMLKLRKLQPKPADIGSAALTGLLLALTLPPALPWYAASLGAVIAIIIAKHFFGGLGYNIFNPALVGRAFLVASWPVIMTTWLAPLTGVDAVTTATPLALVKSQFNADPTLRLNALGFPSLSFMAADPMMLLTNIAEHGQVYVKLLFGAYGGCIGETSALALILGGIYLLWRKVIEWRIPLSYIGTVMIISILFNQDPFFHVLAGGLLLGALFMATDPVTSPVTKPGRWILGIGCGIITMVIRFVGGYPEGVCYSILIMNAAVPLLDRYFRGRTFGT